MKLKNKILIVLVSVIVAVTIVYYAVFRVLIFQSFIDLEREDAVTNMDRCVATLDREIGTLNRFCHDWAAWDDTYRFVQDHNQEFITSNLQWEVCRDQKLNLIQIYDLKGKLIAGKAFDLKTGNDMHIDLSLELRPWVFSALVRQKDEQKSVKGIILTSRGPMMITANPILTSAVTGPSRGVIMMGRILSDEVIAQISEQVEAKLTAFRPGTPEFASLKNDLTLSSPHKRVLREEGPDTISAYTFARDISGKPAILLKASLPRAIFKKGERAYHYGFLFIIVVGVLLLVLVGRLIQHLVLNPVSKLNDNVLAISGGEDRVDDKLLARKDELGTLSHAFNDMVQSLREREHTLWQSEQRLRQIIDLVPHFIFAKDEDGRYILANKALANTFGCDVKELIGRYDSEFVKPDEASLYSSVDSEVLATGEQKTVPEETVTDARGRTRILQTTKLPFTFSGTDKPAVLGISVDITDAKNAEKAIRESERRLADIINFLPDATVAIDRKGMVIAWNRAMEKLTGVAQEDMLGKGDYAYAVPFYGDKRPMLLDLIHEPRGDMYRLYDFIHTIDDMMFVEVFIPRLFEGKGAYLWAVAAKLYDSSGEVVGSIECIRDITLRKKDEELLMHQRAIIEQSLDGISMSDLDGRLLYVNNSFALMHGYSPDELVGRSFRVLFTEDQFRDEMIPAIEQLKTLGCHSGKLEHRRKDGSNFMALATSFTLKDYKGDSVGIISIQRDVSDEEKMEKQLLQAQKMEVVGQLAGGVAHDLNNLLSPILGYTEMILNGMSENDPYYHGMFQILTAADRARKLTRQLLAFGSKQVLEMKTVDLGEVVGSYSKMLRRTIREDIEIRITTDEVMPGVQADTSQIGQILLNLALNAQDALPGGGVISIETTVTCLDEAYAAAHQGFTPGEYVQLTVSDTGMGIEKEILEHIFEPFFTTKDRGKGTGLGLATVYGIVNQHGGHINVYSEPGMGTTFKIYLPRVGGEVEKAPDRIDFGNGKHGKETIVVAEDDEGVRVLTCEVLEKHGYRVISAPDIKEFMRLIDEADSRIDLMLTDVIMPGMNGKQLYERIRTDHPEMRVLFMSGYTDDVIAHHGILDRGVNFIQKPFTIQSLTEKVRTVLDEA